MSTLTPYTVELLAQDLHRLMKMRVADRHDLHEWYQAARIVQARLAVSGSTLPHLPETVWHYLIDADTRLKDPRYAKMQTERMQLLLEQMDRGILPDEKL
jgi:hypothetical protein